MRLIPVIEIFVEHTLQAVVSRANEKFCVYVTVKLPLTVIQGVHYYHTLLFSYKQFIVIDILIYNYKLPVWGIIYYWPDYPFYM